MKPETSAVTIQCFLQVVAAKFNQFHFSECDVLYHYMIQSAFSNNLHMVQSFCNMQEDVKCIS